MAGSKILSNLADNVIGLNKSKKDKSARYIIQLKYRSFPIELDYKNVQELRLTINDDWLHFEYGDYDEERTHLPRSRDEKAELEQDVIKELKKPNGMPYRDIADRQIPCHRASGERRYLQKICRYPVTDRYQGDRFHDPDRTWTERVDHW